MNTTKDCENSFDITNGESSPSSFEANINLTKKSLLKHNHLKRIPKVPHTHPSHLSCAQSGSKPSMNVLTSLQRWARIFNFLKSLQGRQVIKTLLFLLLKRIQFIFKALHKLTIKYKSNLWHHHSKYPNNIWMSRKRSQILR